MPENPLGTEPINKLLPRFAIPSIIAMLVGALYNIVDQLFIGQMVGTLGNAATNIAFPLTTCSIAIALMFGIGSAACFNLHMGMGEVKKAPYFIGNAAVMLVLCGALLCIVTEIFLDPMLIAFGSTENILPYAQDYVRITAIGYPFLILTAGGAHLIRADGSPKYSMLCNLTGAIINTALDALFTVALRWGIAGAAYATIIGQIASAILVIRYLSRFKTVPLLRKHLKLRGNTIKSIAKIGMAPCINQLTFLAVQVSMNQLFNYYGPLSPYGADIPIACSGITMKVFQLFFSVVIGIAQGSQPLESFNYGAKQYKRVKQAYLYALAFSAIFTVAAFIVFQVFPHELMMIFDSNGSAEYYEFGEKFFRFFLFLVFLACIQPMTTTFFSAIGKAGISTFLSLTRQILFFLPVLYILPVFMGINGMLYAGIVADAAAATASTIMIVREFRKMKALEAPAA